MAKDQGLAKEEKSPGRLLLPSIIFSTFATYPSAVVTSIFLIEIGLTFGYPVGVMGQIRTSSYIVARAIATSKWLLPPMR